MEGLLLDTLLFSVKKIYVLSPSALASKGAAVV